MQFQSFASWDEMQAAMAEAEAAANTRIQPTQRNIKPGDHVVRLPAEEMPDMLIIGKTFSVEEWVEAERAAAVALGDDSFDAEYERVAYQGRLDRNYLSGQWFSIVEPNGEFGDAHLSVLGGSMPPWMFAQLLHLIKGTP